MICIAFDVIHRIGMRHLLMARNVVRQQAVVQFQILIKCQPFDRRRENARITVINRRYLMRKQGTEAGNDHEFVFSNEFPNDCFDCYHEAKFGVN
ncbi:hypothetical protein D3C86_1889980 [compost metagenome]